MTIEDRKAEFIEDVIILLGNNEMVENFTAYWTEHSPRGKKMRFEFEKVFDIKKRFATWKRNAERFKKPEEAKVISKIEAALRAGQAAIEYFKNKPE